MLPKHAILIYGKDNMYNEEQFKKALSFVQKKTRGQFRANGLPTWHHLARVSNILKFTLNETKEGNRQDKLLIPLASLGHDLLEDTNSSEAEIKEIFEERGLFLIKGMTNWWGDKEKKLYIKQVINSEETVRIIKLADLYDNISDVTYNIKNLGLKWTDSYFLPIVNPMLQAVKKTKFKRYKKTSSLLIFMADAKLSLLLEEKKLLSRSNLR